LDGHGLHFGTRMVRSRRSVALVLVPLIAACTAVPAAHPPARTPAPKARPHRTAVPPTTPAPPPKPVFRAPAVQQLPGLESVIDKNAGALQRLFGKPQLNVHEGDMRKLQFAGEPCVLDVYLYPLKPGAEPVATYVDARRASDGLDVDRTACIAALMRR
jgi:hypothetical protein